MSSVAIGGLYRRAVFGSFNVFSAVSTGMVTYAVMPGNSFNSGFANSMIVSYVTTLCTVVGFILIWLTTPWNVCLGRASTLKVTTLPTLILSTSDSSVLAYTHILVRSCAIVKMVGACKDAATVCPASTFRATTVPSIGERITV